MDIYIFGYGSLMYPSGINGRGMKYVYGWEDLNPVMLLHYKRGMFAHYMNNYYGIMPSENDGVNGIVLKIHSAGDLERLMENEGASEKYRNTKYGLMYEVRDVTKDIYPHVYGMVLAFTNVEDKSTLGSAPKSYIKHVYTGIQPWGQDFVHTFLRTGGIKPSKFVIPFYSIMRNPFINRIKEHIFSRGKL